jgi:hypothetical protein
MTHPPNGKITDNPNMTRAWNAEARSESRVRHAAQHRRYRHFCDAFNITETQKDQLIRDWWESVSQLVALQWNDTPELQILGTNREKLNVAGEPPVDSSPTISSTFNTVAHGDAHGKADS